MVTLLRSRPGRTVRMITRSARYTLVDVVRDGHDGLPRILPEVEQKALYLDLEACLPVEGGEGFIHEQDSGAQAERTGDSGTL
jgi:hypothetical protein